ncbi:hypothetical protein [Verrucomicrobium sp. BvORR106]|uniref:hypothetical protein n=1 Tax=Verrucomicrobium sp. BvORR106 TaxID=1403819 RepID=UPI00057024F3|nr:hypothetical protein [Verrucomicrobium sp. BvORR106]
MITPFPDRPLRVRSSFATKKILGGIGLILLGLGFLVLFVFVEKESITDVLEDHKIWKTGIPATFTEVHGSERTKNFVFHEYSLVVRYGDKEMQPHSADVKFDTFLTSVDQEQRQEARYLESDPKKVALSWAIEASTGRWLAIGFLGVMGIVIGGFSTWGGIGMLRQLTLAKRCGERSEVVTLEITNVTPNVANGKQVGLIYNYRGTDSDGKLHEGKAVFTMKEEPLFADEERKHLVGLHSPAVPGKILVPRSDLHPFVSPVRL